MGVWVVDADVLARARFGTSPLSESFAALSILRDTRTLPWHRPWRDRHLPALRAYLAEHPVQAAIAAHSTSSSWNADFLTVPPARPDLDLEDELAVVTAYSDRRIRSDLRRVRVPLPPELSSRGLGAEAAELLRWIWRTTIAAEWPRRRKILRADVVSRTSRLSTAGWSGVLDNMRPGMRWLGRGVLQINTLTYPPRTIRGKELMFIATHSRGGWVSWDLPHRFAIVYPVTGIFASIPTPTPDSLARLLGGTRALLLMTLAEPQSTTALVATTGLPLGTVGSHLRVLLDAGLLERRRSGREVLYWWSSSAGQLVAGGEV